MFVKPRELNKHGEQPLTAACGGVGTVAVPKAQGQYPEVGQTLTVKKEVYAVVEGKVLMWLETQTK